MANDPNLRVRISADLADIKQGLGLLRGELAKVKQQSAQAFSGTSGNAFTGALRRMKQEVLGFAAAYASISGAKMLAGIADEATRIRGRLREAKGDYEAILSLAQRTRTSFEATTDLYARMERATRTQQISRERLLAITETVNKAVKLSYADTNTANAALTQFAQGLAAGVLRGQDLNSVIAGTPVLAEAIARGLGKQVGQIRKMGEAGELSTTKVLAALENSAQRVSEEFSRVPVTIQDAFTQIKNSFVDYIGKTDQATGASKAFSLALQDIAKNLPKYLDPLLDAIRLLLQNLDALAVLVGTRLALAAIPAMITAVTTLRNAFIALRTATLAWGTVATAMAGPWGIALAAIAAGLYLLWKRTNQAKEAEEQHRKVLEEIDGQAQKNIVSGYQMAAARRQEARDALEAAKAQLQLAKARFEVENTSVTARGGDRGDAAALASTNNLNDQRAKVDRLTRQEKELTDKLHELEQGLREASMQPKADKPTTTPTGDAGKAIAASNALQRDAVSRAIAEVERLYKASEIGTREYFANLTQLQQQAIDLQIQQARNELAAVEANGKGEKDKSAVLERRRKLEEEITILQRDRADVAKKNALDEQQAKDAMIDKLGDVKAQLADLDGDAGRAARIRIYAQFHDLFRQLEADSDETGKAMVQNLVDQLVDKAKLDAVRARVGEITTGLSSREQSISAQIQAGTLGQGEGERQLQDIRQKTLEQLREQRDLQLKILGDMSEGSPLHAQAVQALDEYNAAIANVTASQQKFRQQIEDQAVSSLGGFFDDLIEGAKSFKDAFLDMVRSFVAGVAKMIAQELALRAVRGIFSMFGGGGGQAAYEGAMAAGAFNAKGNAFDSSGLRAFARGAVFPAIAAFAAGGAFTNQVVASPTLFAFGKGGQLGVMGEAGPEAIMPLERGPNGKLGVQAHGAGGAPQSIKVINVWSDDAAANAAAASPAWERVVINHVNNNRGALNGG
ncbi:MAG: phage tail tape measure protein [Proteobacteria bacterium]|nr:phage tail tape measure protein [Pseudomonadota bacterium]